MSAPKEDSAQRVGKKVWAAILRERDGDRAFRLTEATLVACLRAPLLIEFPKAAATAKNGGRDLIFDAIAECAGFDLDCLTREAAKQVATAKRDILEASPGVTPMEVINRYEAYRKAWPTIGKPSPSALAKHWSALGKTVSPETQAKKDIYKEPIGWRSKFKALFPTAELPDATGWFDLSSGIRADLIK